MDEEAEEEFSDLIMSKDMNKSKHSRNGTKTSTFGSPGRFGHDSTKFYSSRLYEGVRNNGNVKYIENELPESITNQILPKSSEDMSDIPDCSVHLMVTSPPYNVGKEYDENLTLEEYRNFLMRIFRQVYRVLVPGGRICLNIANVGRSPYLPLHAYITQDIIECGFLMRGEVIWQKGGSASSSTAWGSWMSPTNPTLRDTHEYILIFSKQSYYRPKNCRKATITRDKFLDYTKSIWEFPAVTAKQTGHPAPFPIELPRRCIELYTMEYDVVLDPFMGSGQTALAALETNRKYIGYEIDNKYLKLAEKRINQFNERQGMFIMEKGVKYGRTV